MCYIFNGDPDDYERFQAAPGPSQGLHLLVDVRHWAYTEEYKYGVEEAGLMIQVRLISFP